MIQTLFQVTLVLFRVNGKGGLTERWNARGSEGQLKIHLSRRWRKVPRFVSRAKTKEIFQESQLNLGPSNNFLRYALSKILFSVTNKEPLYLRLQSVGVISNRSLCKISCQGKCSGKVFIIRQKK